MQECSRKKHFPMVEHFSTIKLHRLWIEKYCSISRLIANDKVGSKHDHLAPLWSLWTTFPNGMLVVYLKRIVYCYVKLYPDFHGCSRILFSNQIQQSRCCLWPSFICNTYKLDRFLFATATATVWCSIFIPTQYLRWA